MDRIHCFILHSIDSGYKLTQNELTEIEKKHINIHSDDDEEHDVNAEVTDNEIKSISNIFVDKTVFIENNNKYELNIDRFTTNIGGDNDKEEEEEEEKKENKKLSTAYSFGYAYKYWQNYLNKKWFIGKKYRNLKSEMTSNDVMSLSMEQFNESVKNAIDLINCKHGKKMRCKYLKESNDPKQDEIGINEGDIITIDHMLSLLFYSNYKNLQILFKNTFIKNTQNESDLSLIQRHSNFANFGQLLYESIHLFGSDISMQKDFTFYHFINEPIIFQHTFSYFYCPVSTFCNLQTAILYNKINKNDHDILLNLDRPHDGVCYYNYFDCCWYSDFTNQHENIFLGSLLKIKSIINITLSTNYQFYLNIFYILTQMLNGNVLYESLERDKVFITDTLKNMMNGNYNDVLNDDHEIDEYVLQLFNHCALRIQNIHINLWLFQLECYESHEIEEKSNDYYLESEDEDDTDNLFGYKIFKQFFISKDNEWIYLQKICKIFTNCNNIYIYNGDWIHGKLIKSITINTVFIDKFINCLSNISSSSHNSHSSNIENIYLYLPNYTKDLKQIITDFEDRFLKIKWNISIQPQTISDHHANFDIVDTICFQKNHSF